MKSKGTRAWLIPLVFGYQVSGSGRRDSVRSSGSQRPTMTENPDFAAGHQQQKLLPQFSDWQSSAPSSSSNQQQPARGGEPEGIGGGPSMVREPVGRGTLSVGPKTSGDPVPSPSLLTVPNVASNALVPPPLSRSYVTLAIPEECVAEAAPPLLRSRFPARPRPEDHPTGGGGGSPVDMLDVRIPAANVVKRRT